ncbi:uncharacterized protein METZ01_LOCUS433442, partial [marine metagenome]
SQTAIPMPTSRPSSPVTGARICGSTSFCNEWGTGGST